MGLNIPAMSDALHILFYKIHVYGNDHATRLICFILCISRVSRNSAHNLCMHIGLFIVLDYFVDTTLTGMILRNFGVFCKFKSSTPTQIVCTVVAIFNGKNERKDKKNNIGVVTKPF